LVARFGEELVVLREPLWAYARYGQGQDYCKDPALAAAAIKARLCGRNAETVQKGREAPIEDAVIANLNTNTHIHKEVRQKE
jgi:hypothetical protein